MADLNQLAAQVDRRQKQVAGVLCGAGAPTATRIADTPVAPQATLTVAVPWMASLPSSLLLPSTSAPTRTALRVIYNTS
jgi:hypothetical protein